MCGLLPISGVVLVVLTRGLVVSPRDCGSLLCGWPVSRVGVGYGFDGWSHRHPYEMPELKLPSYFPVCLSAWNSTTATQRILIKFRTWNFYENLSLCSDYELK